MTGWLIEIAAATRAAIRVVRFGEAASPGVERLAAAAIGLAVLAGAVATYVVLPGPSASSPPTAPAPGSR